MTTTVHSYTRRVNGRQYTVHGYTQADGQTQQVVDQHKVAALPAVYQNPRLVQTARFTHGLVPHALFPLGSNVPDNPTQIWVRHASVYDPKPMVAASALLSEHFIALSSSLASEDWQSAIQVGLEHILLVMRNNPTKSMADILKRPDVQEALREAAEKGRIAVRHDVTRTWLDQNAPTASTYLSSLLDDIDSNAQTFPARVSKALTINNADAVKAIIYRDRLRASAAQAVAETRAKAEALLATQKKNGIQSVRWVSRLDASTCSYCKALHGDVVKIGQSFDAAKLGKLKLYHDLTTPPAHVNCRCTLEVVPSKKKVKI